MKYNDLLPIQKQMVDELVRLDSSLRYANSITRVQIEKLWHIILENRSKGGPFLGYPNWIVKGRKINRGVYEFPGPETEQEDVESFEHKEFFDELESHGLRPNRKFKFDFTEIR